MMVATESKVGNVGTSLWEVAYFGKVKVCFRTLSAGMIVSSYQVAGSVEVFFPPRKQTIKAAVMDLEGFLADVAGRLLEETIEGCLVILQLNETSLKWRFIIVNKFAGKDFCSKFDFATENKAKIGARLSLVDADSPNN